MDCAMILLATKSGVVPPPLKNISPRPNRLLMVAPATCGVPPVTFRADLHVNTDWKRHRLEAFLWRPVCKLNCADAYRIPTCMVIAVELINRTSHLFSEGQI